MIEYAPGMRLIIRDEEWMIKKIDTNEIGEQALNCIGISPLVKDKEAIFLLTLRRLRQLILLKSSSSKTNHRDTLNRFSTLKVSGDRKTPPIRISISVTKLLWI